MITKLVNSTGKITYAKTQEPLTAGDFPVGGVTMVHDFFYKILAVHIEFIKNEAPIRVVMVEEV